MSMSSAPTVQQALAQSQATGLPRLEAQMLLLLALQRPPHDRAWLLAHDSDSLSAAAQMRLAELQQRRLDGEPMAYLSGEHEFYGLTLRVDARVLDPRPDTETLVDWALAQLPQQAGLRAADLGTGSGAIALAIAQQRPDVQVSAVDASADALAVAQANGERLHLPVSWHLGDWFSPLAGQRFELLVSNPPYIAEADPHMASLRHEPRRALTSGEDGLDDLRRLVQDAPEHLQIGGWLLLEHGWDQAEAVRALLSARGFSSVQSRVDLAGIERCSGGQWPGLR